MKVLHWIPALNEEFGGPSRSVTALCDALASHVDWVGLATLRLAGCMSPMVLPADARVEFFSIPGRYIRWLRLSYAVGLGAELTKLVRAEGALVIHNHGIWQPSNHSACLAARHLGLPVVISPRGMLMSWPLTKSRVRKSVAMSLFQKADLDQAASFVATSEEEAADLRAYGIRCPIAVIPNGVRSVNPGGKLPAFTNRTIGFLSRLHPKKGLLKLLDAWAKAVPKGWRLVLAGPDEVGHRAEILRRIDELGIGMSVEVRDAVPESYKGEFFQSCDIAVLPSESENFGMMVAEALSAGIPVIASRATPWSILEAEGCGWWVSNSPDALSRALSEATSLSPDELRNMGARGAAMVAARYSWDAVGRQTASLYEWLCARGDEPKCLYRPGETRP
jgi:glycosyltransferase involved in cell wall biosynthesis